MRRNSSVADIAWMMEKWDFEKNTVDPHTIPHATKEIEVWWKCPVCGNGSKMKPINVKKTNGCGVCRGNKYYFLGKDGTYSVYCHTTPDGKKYIGMTKMPINTRFGNGANYNTPLFSKAIEKFGWENIKHEILEYGLTREQASESEIKYINLYNTLDPEHGYNIATGGVHGSILNKRIIEETRRKISQAHIGKTASIETKRKLSESHKGLDNHQSKAVIKLSLDGEVLDEYESMKVAAEKNGLSSHVSIWKVCNGMSKTAGGFKWRYK